MYGYLTPYRSRIWRELALFLQGNMLFTYVPVQNVSVHIGVLMCLGDLEQRRLPSARRCYASVIPVAGEKEGETTNEPEVGRERFGRQLKFHVHAWISAPNWNETAECWFTESWTFAPVKNSWYIARTSATASCSIRVFSA